MKEGILKAIVAYRLVLVVIMVTMIPKNVNNAPRNVKNVLDPQTQSVKSVKVDIIYTRRLVAQLAQQDLYPI